MIYIIFFIEDEVIFVLKIMICVNESRKNRLRQTRQKIYSFAANSFLKFENILETYKKVNSFCP